ncbi:peptidoglycan DD-metalloendopeptidase family protein [Aetokthonos hydrillicola]|uniref:peptidoglycan DD-metalloendopeptidase family protein n=1 Tax=Aetokthonos hydrillicola TaxID=1550245 RepID=UPI001ABA8132|nr:peptidoglycan DD-metalloendopeptidase family protein [Aetokthonos hydrillicola]MBO3459741.1 peptidoglycan DD-metalloendopeptidase family protein [Aetokthonos hydrillicola CCALA 1050]MBW4585173.1 peptidoglycan DD-metalloendopeptidase family protein [Aetokthonos hydrillicola CCALA 1050]
MKRALKKREKAVQENTPSDDASTEQLSSVVHSRVNRRMPTKAAMIGLAISMGATSFLVTRQSDQALAAEPVGNQNTTSTIPAAADTEVKFVPTKSLESQAVSSVSVPEHHAVMEPTAISQMSGLGAKSQVAASGMPVKAAAPVVVPSNVQQAKEQTFPSVKPDLQNSNKSVYVAENTSPTVQPQIAAGASTVDQDLNAQLKAQQEFALNNLQEKSNRLRKSLAQLRARRTANLSQTATGFAQPSSIGQNLPQTTNVSKASTDQSEALSQASRREKLGSTLKHRSVETQTSTAAATPTTVTSPAPTAYGVKSGDTLEQVASNYGTSVSELIRANSLSDPNQLKISQKLIIPGTENRNTNTFAAASTNTSTNTAIASNGSTTSVTSTNPQIPVIAKAITNTSIPTETVTSPTSAYGMGGDSPIPQAIADMQRAKNRVEGTKQAKNSKNPRLRSLQDEIERLREKYRAQQSGNSATIEAPQSNNVSEQASVVQQSNQAVPIPVPQENNQTVPIPVPRPMEFNYSNKPAKGQVRATRPDDDDAINPEFLPNRNTNFPTPVGNVDSSQSLGRLRGTTVSPTLPPLAAVDRYLPRPIDETTPSPVIGHNVYIWPAKGTLTSGFGMRWGRMHKGIDVANSTGTPVYASADGVIEKAGWNNGGYGNLVDIRHPDGSLTRYGHNSKILVRIGQQVHQGETIALMGSTGFSTGPHSHFEVHPSGKGAVNPIAFLPRI